MTSDTNGLPAAALVFKVTEMSDRWTFEITDTNGSQKYVGSFLAERVSTQIEKLSQELPKAMRMATSAPPRRGGLPGLDFTTDTLEALAKKLVNTSRDLAFAMCGKRVAGELFTIGAEVLNDLEHDGTGAPIAPIVEISTPKNFWFPFELISWTPSGTDPGIPATDRLRSSLLGMSAVIRRTYNDVELRTTDTESGESGSRIDTRDRLGMTIVHAHNGSEVGFLTRELKDEVYSYGPFPRAKVILPKDALVQHLLDPSKPIEGLGPEIPISIVYLQGHSDTTSKYADYHYFCYAREIIERETDDDTDRFHLQSLTRGCTEGWLAEACPRPLVFMNSCGSAGLQSVNISSFAGFFQEMDYQGLLGTLWEIRLPTAADFAKVFFRELLQGKPVGRAILEAQQHLLDVHNNPFGVFYTFYGNSDLRVTHSKTGSLVPVS